jgi:hypothetical protein
MIMVAERELLIYATLLLVMALFVVLHLKRRDELQKARLKGMQQAVGYMMLGCGRHYERENEPLPDAVAKALDNLDYALKLDTPESQADVYAVGVGVLANAMGEAAAKRGAQEASNPAQRKTSASLTTHSANANARLH